MTLRTQGIEADPDRIKLLLDPWSSDYTASVQAQPEGDEEPVASVDISVESPDWSAQTPGAAPASIAFVDGTRRLEARLIGWRDGQIIHGLAGTFATGAVVVENSRARFEGCVAERRLVLTSGLSRTESLAVGNASLVFQALCSSGTNPTDMVLALQNEMRKAEASLAGSLDSEAIFLDGPLAYLTQPKGPVVGVVKTIHRLYLDEERMKLVFRLRTGERTPLFAIREGQKDRYSWYLRIGMGRAIHHGLTGIVRLEAGAASGVENAIAMANCSAACLPRFASTAARDPRAPQNLTPVGALEDHLRTLMGDATLIQRAVERRISEGLFL